MSKKTPVTLALLLLSVNAIAQSPADTIDVVALRAETRQLERDMYELFNKLNSTDEFDVACGERKITGSTIPTWQCDAAFMREALSTDTARRVDNNFSGNNQFANAPQSSNQVAFRYRKKTEQLNEEMQTLGRQHPELGAKMIALHAKRQELERLEKK